MRMPRHLLLMAFGILAALTSVLGNPIDLSKNLDWEIASTSDTITWVEIHPDIKSDAWIHVEVLQKKKRAPAWDVLHVQRHIALTLDALKRSVIRPLKFGSVYPEQFEEGFREWKSKSPPDVCSTSLQDYLKLKK